MAQAVEPGIEEPLFVDPDRVPVHVVDQITMHGLTGNLLDMTCCEIRKTPLKNGTVDSQAVVVGRLRFSVGLATAIRDLLDKHIAAATGTASADGRGESVTAPSRGVMN